MDPHLRAGDADRRQVIDALTGHSAAGRLTLDEFTARVDTVNQSKTYGELAAVSADLPPAVHPPRTGRPAVLATFVVTAVLLAVLLGAVVVAAATGWGHMNAMMASMNTAMGCR